MKEISETKDLVTIVSEMYSSGTSEFNMECYIKEKKAINDIDYLDVVVDSLSSEVDKMASELDDLEAMLIKSGLLMNSSDLELEIKPSTMTGTSEPDEYSKEKVNYE